jgi:hypothetical protein
LLPSDGPLVLEAIDMYLASLADRIERTRKGRVWDIWVDGCPVRVAVVTSTPAVELSAGCNRAEDYAVLRKLTTGLAATCGGSASEPTK